MIKLVLRNPDNQNMVCITCPDDWDGKSDLPGYAGWIVLEQRQDNPPEYATWVDGQGWIVDESLKAASEETARLNTLTRAEYMAEIDAKITQLNVLLATNSLKPS